MSTNFGSPPSEVTELLHMSSDGRSMEEMQGLLLKERPKPQRRQIRALLYKTITLQLRAKYTLCCQCVVPFFIILFIGLIQVTFNYYIKNNSDIQGIIIDAYKHNEGKYVMGWDIDSGEYIQTASGTPNPLIGELAPNGSYSGFIGHLNAYRNCINVSVCKPYSVQSSETTIDGLQDSIGDLKQKYSINAKSGADQDDTPYPGLTYFFNNLTLQGNATAGYYRTLDVVVMAESQMAPMPFPKAQDFGYYVAKGVMFMVYSIIDMATASSPFGNIVYYQMPFKLTITVDIGSFIAMLLFPLSLSFLFPVFVYNIVLEKQDKLREMMRMSGMSMWKYWLVTFAWDAFLYTGVVLLVGGGSVLFMIAIVWNGSTLANLITVVLWGVAMIAQAFFLSTIFNSTRAAVIVCYIGVILLSLVSFVVNSVWFQAEASPWWWNIHPFFAFSRIITILGFLCGADLCPQWSDYMSIHFEITQLWIYLAVETVFAFVLALYLDQVIPREWGVTKKPWFPIKAPIKWTIKLVKWIIRKIQQSRKGAHPAYETLGGEEAATAEQGLYSDPRVLSSSGGGGVSALAAKGPNPDDDASSADEAPLDLLDEPEDVQREREAVYHGAIPPDSPVVIRDLVKNYTGAFGRVQKRAVRGLTMHIPKGECFGLLGPNGAGKTTTISILTGLYGPSSGQALVGGFDVRTEMDQVHQVMGICPQFEIMWMDLTCLETLLFYARLKGVPRREEKAESRRILDSVGLLKSENTRVGRLSGGMRRRMAVAVSLVGDPQIVFLDEPTTGLDPQSRRQLWQVIAEAKKGRSLVLTTHSMDEADYLCDRIGIMSKGALRCIAPQQDLKNRYGSGYTIVINFVHEHVAEVEALVTDLIPNAEVTDRYAGQLTYHCGFGELIISSVFERLEAARLAPGSHILDWGVTQTTLEDVFLRIVRADETEVYS